MTIKPRHIKRQLSHTLDVTNSLWASLASLGRGTQVNTRLKNPSDNKPKKMLMLYDIENCPYCRLVREALTELNLDVIIYPCPKRGTRFRSIAKQLGGKLQFPFLVDPNTDTKLYESIDIICYLKKTYGGESNQHRLPNFLTHHLVKVPTSTAASLLRLGKGTFCSSHNTPSSTTADNNNAQTDAHSITAPETATPETASHENQCTAAKNESLIQLYGFESSPFARLVREQLCVLEIPYIMINVGKTQWKDYLLPAAREKWLPDHQFSGAKRRAMAQTAGEVMVPYLVDPNTNTAMFHSEQICQYLRDTYAEPHSLETEPAV